FSSLFFLLCLHDALPIWWMYVTPVQVDDALHRPHQKSLNPVVVFSDDDEGRGQVFQRPATGSPPQINDRQRSAADVRHAADNGRSEEHTSELQSRENLVC